ncbi:MAG: hypothetical protein WCP55_08010, partial [Lentisphaerota bacterium]
MTGFELKGKQRMLSFTQIIEKSISDFFTGLFYSYVSDTQPSIHPIIHGPVVKKSKQNTQEIENEVYVLPVHVRISCR